MVHVPKLKTGVLGGVENPSVEQLGAMRDGDCILRAHGGELTSVKVEKCRLPHDSEANPQAIEAALGPDGSVYVRLASILCKSGDGGRTWEAYEPGLRVGCFQVLSDGTFVEIGEAENRGDILVLPVVSSADEGRSWRRVSEIALAPERTGGPYAICCLPDDVLVCGVSASNLVMDDASGYISGSAEVCAYRSADGGATWDGPLGRVCTWGSEGNIIRAPSGKLLAVIRHQRPLLPDDPPELMARVRPESEGAPDWPYKNVFLVDSHDDGRTWEGFRQLTTVFGQTRGVGAALGDGTVVVVHDTRYGPGSPGSRAMVSRDEGRTWEDEVYYLDRTYFTGSYNATLAIEDDLLLTIGGWSDAANDWEAVLDHTHFTAIRWRPVTD